MMRLLFDLDRKDNEQCTHTLLSDTKTVDRRLIG